MSMHARTVRYAPLFALCLVLTAPGADRAEGPRGIQALVKGLKAASPADRVKAAEALGKLGQKAESTAGALCLAVADPDEEVRHAALEALATVAPDIQKDVVTLAVDQDVGRHVRAGASLLRLGEKGAPAAPLIREHVRLATATARSGKPAPPLPFQGTPGSDWFEGSFRLLKHLPDEQTVRVIAAVAEIDTSRQRDEHTVQELRYQVVQSLAQLGKAKKDLRKPITRALLLILAKRDYQPGSSESSVHAQIVRTLQALGPDAREALPALKKLRYHPQAHIRGSVAEAIKVIGR
jgi:HEAT repeat protein